MTDHAAEQRIQLSKDIGKVAGRVAVLEAGMEGVGETLDTINDRLALIEEHSRMVCAAAKFALFAMKVLVPCVAGLVAIAGGLRVLGYL